MREKASEMDRVVGVNLKIVWGNLQAMTDYGAIFKNYQAKMGLLESKLSKNILVDCTFISSMQKIPLKLNWCQTIHKCYPWTLPSSYTRALYINIVKHQLLKSDLFFFYLNQVSAKNMFYIDLESEGPKFFHFYNWKWQLVKAIQHVISTVNMNHCLLISQDFRRRSLPNYIQLLS